MLWSQITVILFQKVMFLQNVLLLKFFLCKNDDWAENVLRVIPNIFDVETNIDKRSARSISVLLKVRMFPWAANEDQSLSYPDDWHQDQRGDDPDEGANENESFAEVRVVGIVTVPRLVILWNKNEDLVKLTETNTINVLKCIFVSILLAIKK